MVRCRPSVSSTSSPSLPVKRNSGQPERDTFNLDGFVSSVYLPYIRLRKRSWRVDERIARQHLSPTFGARELADIQRHEVEDWLHGLSSGGLAPATCNRILAVFKTICSLAVMRGLLLTGQSPCAGVSPFKSTRSGNATSRGMRHNGSCGRWKKRPAGSLCHPSASADRGAQERSPQGALGTRPPGFAAAHRTAVQVRQASSYSAVRRGHNSHSLHPAPARDPLAVPRPCSGKALSDLYLFWNRLRRSIGLADVRIHDLRHTFASFLVNAGHSLYEVQNFWDTAIPGPPCAMLIWNRHPWWPSLRQ